MIKILMLSANPANSERLRLDQEARDIQRVLQPFSLANQISIVTAWAVEAVDIIANIDYCQPNILHFAGHGGRDIGFLLNDSNAINSDQFMRLITVVANRVEMVVLNYCNSLPSAEKIRNVVPTLIGTNASVSDQAAIRFSSLFYNYLCYTRDADEAFERTTLALSLSGLEDGGAYRIFHSKKTILSPQYQSFESVHSHLMRRPEGRATHGNPTEVDNPGANLEKRALHARLLKRLSRGGIYSVSDVVNSIANEYVTRDRGCSFVLADIDNLTQINHFHSERCGNEVISRIEQMLEKYFDEGIVGRCGDDTFMVLLPPVDIQILKRSVDQVCAAIKKCEWDSLSSKLFVSCTFGISTKGEIEDALAAFVRAAVAMADGKSINKGAVHFAPHVLPPEFNMKMLDEYGIFSGHPHRTLSVQFLEAKWYPK